MSRPMIYTILNNSSVFIWVTVWHFIRKLWIYWFKNILMCVQVTSSFTSRDTQGFQLLTDRDDYQSVSDGLSANPRSRQLVYRALPPGECYWLLPAKFIGNKVISVWVYHYWLCQLYGSLISMLSSSACTEHAGNCSIVWYRCCWLHCM